MRHRFIAIATLLALLGLTGCADPMVGAYTYTGSVTTTFTQPVMGSNVGMTQGTLSITPSSAGADYQIDAVATGSTDHCVLRANRNGSGLVVLGGQSCQVPVQSGTAMGTLTATITSGSGVLSGSALTLTVQYTFSGNIGIIAVAGTANQVLNATRAGN